jgi:hypothetical protein
MIAVSQDNSHKSLVKRSIASLNKTARTVRAWSGNEITLQANVEIEERKKLFYEPIISIFPFRLYWRT